MNITFERSACASLAYEVLSHLDLGKDPASLYRRRLAPPSWVGPLRDAYSAAAGPERLALQFAGLKLDALERMLEAEGSELWRRFALALDAEAASFQKRFEDAAPHEEALIRRAAEQLRAPLAQLRAALWAPRAAPPLRVLHVPALGRAGRGYAQRAAHRVAVSLDEPWEHALCQIFHEEVHPISDRELGPIGERDTGSDLHLLIEAHAIERGEEVVQKALPELSAGYARWRARFISPASPRP